MQANPHAAPRTAHAAAAQLPALLHAAAEPLANATAAIQLFDSRMKGWGGGLHGTSGAVVMCGYEHEKSMALRSKPGIFLVQACRCRNWARDEHARQ